MAAKTISLSSDGGTTYFVLPGNSGELRNDGAEIDDTIFGANFRSNFPGLINWGVTANGIYKGFAGYEVDISEIGTASVFTAESMTLVSGKTYRIDDATKEIWDRSEVTMDILDSAASVADADIESIDFLFGKVTFVSSYTPSGAITATGKFFPVAAVGKAQSYNLTQTAEAIENTDFVTAQANSGRRTFEAGLKTVALELTGVYDLTNGFLAALLARAETIIEINPDGNQKSRCRGFFRLISEGQSGDVGALEEETVNFSLSVPDNVPAVEFPFSWDHANDTTLNTAIQKALTSWQDESALDVEYLSDGVAGLEGVCVVTEISLAGGLETMHEFNISVQGTGATTPV